MTLQSDLKELLRLAREATPGEWSNLGGGTIGIVEKRPNWNAITRCVAEYLDNKDAAFIAAAKNFFEKHGADIERMG